MTNAQKAEVIEILTNSRQQCLLCGRVVPAVELPLFTSRDTQEIVSVAIHNACAAAVLHVMLERPATPELASILGEAAVLVGS